MTVFTSDNMRFVSCRRLDVEMWHIVAPLCERSSFTCNPINSAALIHHWDEECCRVVCYQRDCAFVVLTYCKRIQQRWNSLRSNFRRLQFLSITPTTRRICNTCAASGLRHTGSENIRVLVQTTVSHSLVSVNRKAMVGSHECGSPVSVEFWSGVVWQTSSDRFLYLVWPSRICTDGNGRKHNTFSANTAYHLDEASQHQRYASHGHISHCMELTVTSKPWHGLYTPEKKSLDFGKAEPHYCNCDEDTLNIAPLRRAKAPINKQNIDYHFLGHSVRASHHLNAILVESNIPINLSNLLGFTVLRTTRK